MAMTGFRRLARTMLVLMALAASWLATEARAGCGTIVTLNSTQYWVWITIYDLGKLIHLDYGPQAPHSVRTWTGGAAGLPYACGSYYHVRYQVKNNSGPAWVDGPDIGDTSKEINPQLTLLDALKLVKSIGTAIVCVTPEASGACLARWGLSTAGTTAVLGAPGQDSTGSVVCLKSNAPWNFWIDGASDCLQKPGPYITKYTFQPGSRNIGIGVNTRNWYFNIAKNGTPIQDNAVYEKGRFYTDNPGIATFPNPHSGHLKGVKAGKTTAHWDLDGKRQASAEIVVK